MKTTRASKVKAKAPVKKAAKKTPTKTHLIGSQEYKVHSWTFEPKGKLAKELQKGLDEQKKADELKLERNKRYLKEVGHFIEGLTLTKPYSPSICKIHAQAIWDIYNSL